MRPQPIKSLLVGKTIASYGEASRAPDKAQNHIINRDTGYSSVLVPSQGSFRTFFNNERSITGLACFGRASIAFASSLAACVGIAAIGSGVGIAFLAGGGLWTLGLMGTATFGSIGADLYSRKVCRDAHAQREKDLLLAENKKLIPVPYANLDKNDFYFLQKESDPNRVGALWEFLIDKGYIDMLGKVLYKEGRIREKFEANGNPVFNDKEEEEIQRLLLNHKSLRLRFAHNWNPLRPKELGRRFLLGLGLGISALEAINFVVSPFALGPDAPLAQGTWNFSENVFWAAFSTPFLLPLFRKLNVFRFFASPSPISRTRNIERWQRICDQKYVLVNETEYNKHINKGE